MMSAALKVRQEADGSSLRTHKLMARCRAAGLSVHAGAILVVLEAYTNREAGHRWCGLAWPSVKTLALEVGCKEDTASAALDDLMRAGLVLRVVARRGNQPARYRVPDTRHDPVPVFRQPPPQGQGRAPAIPPPPGPIASGPDPRQGAATGPAIPPETGVAIPPETGPIDKLDRQRETNPCAAQSAAQASGGDELNRAEAREPIQVHLPTVAANHVDLPPALGVARPQEGHQAAAPCSSVAAPSDPVARPERAPQVPVGKPVDAVLSALAPPVRSGPKGRPPFSVLAALETLRDASGGRIAVGNPTEWASGHVVAVRKLIRLIPDLERWRCVGKYLATGVDDWKGREFTIAWVASNHFRDALIRADAWHAKGRPDTGRAKRAPAPAAAYSRRESPASFDSAVYRTGAAERLRDEEKERARIDAAQTLAVLHAAQAKWKGQGLSPPNPTPR